MTPEEIAEIRVLVNRLKNIDDDNIKTILGLNAQKLLEHIDSQAEQIKRLEERCRQEEKHTNKYINYLHKEQLKGEKQRLALEKLGEKVRSKHRAWREEQTWHDIDLGRVKRLEDALVEERARRLVAAGAECFFRTPIKGSILSKCDKGIYCDWTTCPIKDEKRQDARDQLRAEGVIR